MHESLDSMVRMREVVNSLVHNLVGLHYWRRKRIEYKSRGHLPVCRVSMRS